jgi:hypothetical protein
MPTMEEIAKGLPSYVKHTSMIKLNPKGVGAALKQANAHGKEASVYRNQAKGRPQGNAQAWRAAGETNAGRNSARKAKFRMLEA